MVRFFLLGLVVLALSACGHDLAPTASDDDTSVSNQPRNLQPADDVPADDVPADDVPADDVPADDVPADENPPLAPGPPPAQAQQSCQEWTDCGPNYANPNSGFDCAQNSCVCNVDGNWDEACTEIHGVWSEEECFCFMGTTARPTANANDWVADDEDPYEEERTCWWTWRETCEPDTWVDGGYEYVCDGPGNDSCRYRHDDNGGYWESGDCSGYWLRRCDDGSQKRYG